MQNKKSGSKSRVLGTKPLGKSSKPVKKYNGVVSRCCKWCGGVHYSYVGKSGYNRCHYQHNKEAEQKRIQVWRDHNPGRASIAHRWWSLRRLYGVSREDYERLLKSQRGRCLVCLRKFKRTPHVDHDHKTKKVRGLLCSLCNPAMGMFRDKPDALLRAVRYLVGKARAKQIMGTLEELR